MFFKEKFNLKNCLLICLLGLFSFSINYYYGFIGVMPMDNFVLYNGGYRVLNGYIPFTDYWLVTGPLLDYLNAFFFLINGVSWKSYIIHSSIFNLIISISTYNLLVNLGLKKNFSFFYSVLFSILFYPVVGTPFVDHHSTFFLIFSFYYFILGINKNNQYYFILVPFLLCLSFLSKQTPAAYGLIAICPLILIHFFFNQKQIKKTLLSLIYGTVVSILFLFLFLFFTEINFLNFYDQYILYAKNIGDYRFSNYNFNLINVIIKYKFISILLVCLTIILIKLCKKNNKNIKAIFTIITIITLSCLLIFHQFYTLNQNYIFFLIPLLTGIVHIFYKEVFTNKFFLFIFIFLCIYATTKYHIRFNEHRKFNELEKVDLSKAIDAEILTKDLKGLKWITAGYQNNPKDEINNLMNVMQILSKDQSNKALITDYQFLAPSLKIYDFSPNQWHHPSVSFPLENQQYYQKYKSFFIENLKKNNIDFIYETTDKDESIIELVINKECLLKQRVTEILIKFEIVKNCNEFK